jgi:flagellar hook protein FlgE
MSFDTATSGLQSASADLDVIGNNIANANTTGFKSSSAQFADVYAASVWSAPSTSMGNGVALASVSQQFTQGSLWSTGNVLDLAIGGDGFFRLNDNGTIVYSRAGAFTTDAEGYIVNSSGQHLSGYQADADGNITGQLGDLQIDTSEMQPQATTSIESSVNLDSNSEPPTDPWVAPAFGDPPPDPNTYNHATSMTVYDSLGNAHDLSYYYVKTGANTWDVHTTIDGASVDPAPVPTLTFLPDGTLDPAATTSFDITGWQPLDLNGDPNGAAVQDISVALGESTQFGSPFAVNALTQDGYTTGRLAGIAIDESGIISGTYTNGQSQALGQVALANFASPQGLQPIGGTSWAETFASGPPLVGAPGTANLGAIQSGALEQSNVDLTQELVNLIEAQRNFQANAETIQAVDAITQTMINLR